MATTPKRARVAAHVNAAAAVIDVEGLHQSIADLESLAAHPGWKILGDVAQHDYGLRPFAATIASFCKLPSAQAIGEQTLAVVSAREAVVRLMGLPTALIAEARATLARAALKQDEPPPFPPDVEHSS